jgi:DNA invertase Pin-like site-specific DNA recombinase
MTTAAIYARKSTEQDVHEEAKSVTRQVESATAYAGAKGWTVVAEFVDDGISGALDETKRPGLRSMLEAAERRTFDVLVVAADDRLARDQWTAGTILARLSKAGIRLFYYQEQREVDLSGAVGKFLEAVRSFGSEFFRESARAHMVDALKRKAKAGHVHGGRTFGYENIRVDGHVERRINQAEATVIRQVFTRYAAGHSLGRIATDLNRAGAPCPSKSGGWQPGGWSKGPVRDALHRETYRGLVRSRWGDETIEVQTESMRIVPESLWAATRERLTETRRSYLRSTGGKLYGKPASGHDSKYLLTSMLACGSCGATMTVRSRKHGRRRAFVYMCMSNIHGRVRQRAAKQCTNAVPLPMPAADHAILSQIESTILRPEVITATIQECLRRLDPGKRAARRAGLEREAQILERELGNLTRAIAQGRRPESLLAEIERREGRRTEIQADLARLAQAEQLASLDLTKLESQLRERLKDWQGLLARHVLQARQILGKLLPTRLVMTPEPNGYRFEGTGRITPLIRGLIPTSDLQEWWPQRDSNPCLPSAMRLFISIGQLRDVDSTSCPGGFKFDWGFSRWEAT